MNNINKNALIGDLNGAFGVSIDKYDVSRAGVRDDIPRLKQLFDQHHVLVFKNQNLSEKQQIEFTKLWGSLENFPEADKTKDSVTTYHVANVSAAGDHLSENHTQSVFQKVNQLWHTDSSYRFIPSFASLLYAIEVLPNHALGGETEFVDMFSVYKNLSDEKKAAVESLHMVHYYEYGRRIFPQLPAINSFERENVPPVSHPLVRVHQNRKGSRSLFFTENAGGEVSGMDHSSGKSLHAELVAAVSGSHYKLKHRWSKGDLVMWDNRCLVHRAVPYDMNNYRRVLRRTTVAGKEPVRGPFSS